MSDYLIILIALAAGYVITEIFHRFIPIHRALREFHERERGK